jgi:hypothetical protein
LEGSVALADQDENAIRNDVEYAVPFTSAATAMLAP